MFNKFQKFLKIFQENVKNISKKCFQILKKKNLIFQTKFTKFLKNVKKYLKKVSLKILHDKKSLLIANTQFVGFNIIVIINCHYLKILEL